MSDYGILDLGRSLIQSFYGSATTGLTGCTAQGLEDECTADEYAPKAGSPLADPEYLDSYGFATFGQPVRFVLPWASTCSGDAAGLEVLFSLGDTIP